MGQHDDARRDIVLLRQSGEARLRDGRILDHQRRLVVRPDAMQPEHGLAGAKLQLPRLGLGGCRRREVAAFRVAGDPQPVGIANVAEPQGLLGGRLVDHEGAAALAAGDQPLALHFVERFAHRADADAELTRQLDLVGDRGPWLPGTGRDALNEHVLHLKVEGASGEPSYRCHWRPQRLDALTIAAAPSSREVDAFRVRPTCATPSETSALHRTHTIPTYKSLIFCSRA